VGGEGDEALISDIWFNWCDYLNIVINLNLCQI